MATALDRAFDIVERYGVPVFPLAANKAPACENGFKDATKDPEEIRRLFADPRAALVGVPTGAVSSFDVFDIDRYKPEGGAWLQENAAKIPITARVQETRSGGWHVFFRHRDGMRNSSAKGIDVRGDGGYVVWWEGEEGCRLIRDAAIDGCEWPDELLRPVLAKRPTVAGSSTPKDPDELAPPDAATLIELLDDLPNPAGVDRDYYVDLGMAVQGCIRGLEALEKETEGAAEAWARWAARWEGKASRYEDELAKFNDDFAHRTADLSGWRKVLEIAWELGLDTTEYRQHEAAADFNINPQPQPKTEFFDPWDRLLPPEFPFDVLPGRLQDVVTDTSDLLGTCIGSTSMVYLGAIAGAVHGRTRVRVKRYDQWTEAALLWIALVADPSSKKTPLINRALAPIARFEQRLLDHYLIEKADWDATDKKERGPEPKPTSYLISDATIEKVNDLLSVHERGALMHLDELSGWIGGMERYGAGAGAAARSFYLEAYQGGRKRQDRIGRGTVVARNLAVGIIGGIQVDKVAKLAKDGGLTDDGLLQRFLPVLMEPPREDVDRPPSPAYQWYDDYIAKLLEMGAQEYMLDEEGHEIRGAAFRAFLKMAEANEYGKGFRGAMGKATAHMMRLALTLHMADEEAIATGNSVIPASTIAKAVKLMDYVQRSNATFYTEIGGGIGSDETKLVASYILRHDGDTIKLRDFKRNVFFMRSLSEQEALSRLSPLVGAEWLFPAEPYPCKVWGIAPGLKDYFSKHAEVLKLQAAERLSMIRTAAAVRRGQKLAA